MRLPPSAVQGHDREPVLVALQRRSTSNPKVWVSYILGFIALVICIPLVIWYITKLFRLGGANVGLSPIAALRRKWRQWRSGSRQAKYNAELQTTTASPPASRGNSTSDGRLQSEMSGDRSRRERAGATTSEPDQEPEPGIDRTASVRSVMTLPAYSPAARPTEQILGREGERAGIDVVVEHPETAEEEETRRDEEMESLYQIRRVRRQELDQREEERRRLRDARQRGDLEPMTALPHQERRSRAASALSAGTATTMLAEHQTAYKQAERRVPSVQYGDLGVARHDGTRLRASSVESSDSRPLLDSAASFDGRSGLDTPRRLSAASVRTASTGDGDYAYPPPQLPADFINDQGGGNGRANSIFTGTSEFDAGSSLSGVASQQQTEPAPPGYEHVSLTGEDAPPYESAVESRPPSLPLLDRLPSIRIHSSSPIADGRERRQGR